MLSQSATTGYGYILFGHAFWNVLELSLKTQLHYLASRWWRNLRISTIPMSLKPMKNGYLGVARCPLTCAGCSGFLVTPDEVIQDATIGLDQPNPLGLTGWLLAIPPALSDGQLKLGILKLPIDQEMERVLQTDLQDKPILKCTLAYTSIANTLFTHSIYLFVFEGVIIAS